MQQLIYFPDDQEEFIQQVKNKCLAKKVSFSQVILHLLKTYMEEDIYVPTDEPRDVLALKVVALFKEVCPNWKVPDINEQLLSKIVKALEKVRKGPDWWEKLFRKAMEIPWKDWEPDFFWLLDQDNHFKLLSGRYDFMIGQRDHEKHAEERRKKREDEKIEKDRLKKEEDEHKVKEKAEKLRIKQEESERKIKEKAGLAEQKAKEKKRKETKQKGTEKIEEKEEEMRDYDRDFERFGGNE
jgi:hypothetical protein